MLAKSRELAALGATVRDMRTGLGLTQEALAERAGVHPTYVSGVERGVRNVTFKVLLRLLTALETDWGPFGKALSRRGVRL
jgi:transcriptional regulator with XRE-family HTH domain